MTNSILYYNSRRTRSIFSALTAKPFVLALLILALAGAIATGLTFTTAYTALDSKTQNMTEEVRVAIWSNPEIALLKKPEFRNHTKLNEKPAPPIIKTIGIRPGGTLMGALVRGGATRMDAHQAIASLKTFLDPKRLRPEQKITLNFQPTSESESSLQLSSVTVHTSVDLNLITERKSDGTFVSRKTERQLIRKNMHVHGSIKTSLYEAATKQNTPVEIIMRLIRLYSWDVDFQRDIQAGDDFEIFFERLYNDDGTLVGEGEIICASMTLSGTQLRLYRYELGDGTTDYFDAHGASVRKALLKTPVDGARLSSRYGKRKHPVLGYNKMHRGIDFAAPRGTPIMAAGDGVIDVAARNGAYGKYIRIRHNQEYKTAYGHLKSFKKGIRKGVRVRQGDTIGYVGSTGRSTGPHLHYEIHRNGRQVDPMSVKLPSGRKLSGEELAVYHSYRMGIDTAIAQLTSSPLTTAQN